MYVYCFECVGLAFASLLFFISNLPTLLSDCSLLGFKKDTEGGFYRPINIVWWLLRLCL